MWLSWMCWPLGIRDRHSLNGRHIRGGLLCIGKAVARWVSLMRWPVVYWESNYYMGNMPISGSLIKSNYRMGNNL